MPLQNGLLRRGVTAILVISTPTGSYKAQWHHQQSGGAYFCIFVILVCTSYSSFFYAYSVTWTWIYRQRRGCAAYFDSRPWLLTVGVQIWYTVLSVYTKKATFIRLYGAILKQWQDKNCPVDSLTMTGQGYHQINWDNPWYPGLVTFGADLGPEEVLRRKVWNVPSSVTKTCVYHDVTSHFGISKVINKYEALACQHKHTGLGISWDKSHVELSRDIPSVFV